MGKILQQIINRWDGGMTNLLRQDNVRFSRSARHFDTLSDPTQLKPYRDFTDQSFDSGLSASTNRLCKFLAAKSSAGEASDLYALGVASATLEPKILRSNALGAWVAIGTNGAEVRNERVFVEYKGYLMFWRSDAAGSEPGTLDGSSSDIRALRISTGLYSTLRSNATINAATYVAQGIVHSKDDRLYLPYDNIIAVVNGDPSSAGNWTDAGLTLPSNMIVTSICEYGNYLAIAARPKYAINTNSKVFLWDRDTSLTTVTETIDWGPENLEVIDTLDGILVGISNFRNTFSEVITIQSRMVFKYYAGGIQSAKQFLELPFAVGSGGTDARNIRDKQKINNRIFFLVSGSLYGEQLDAIWSLAKTPNGFAVTIEYLINNDTAITNCEPKGFIKFGDYVFVGFTDGGTYTAKRTHSSATFSSATAKYQTVIFNGGDSAQTKKLLSVTATHEPLPANGQVVVRYSADASIDDAPATFTTILTSSTDDAIRKTAINIESSGANLPTFKEIIFEIQSTGNAVVTGLKFKYEEIDDDVA